MANPFFSGRIPQELHERAESYCKENDTSKTELLINALASYLDFPVEIPKPNYYKQPEVTKEEFEALAARVVELEKMLTPKEDVITNDNKNENKSKDEATKVYEEKTDNQEITYKNSDNKEESQIDNYIDNNVIRVKDLSDITKMQPQQKTNLKNQAFNKASKMGYEISENIRFTPPIEIVYKKGIFVEGKEYELFCEGINENLKPIWLLKLTDNNSYQLNITE